MSGVSMFLCNRIDSHLCVGRALSCTPRAQTHFVVRSSAMKVCGLKSVFVTSVIFSTRFFRVFFVCFFYLFFSHIVSQSAVVARHCPTWSLAPQACCATCPCRWAPHILDLSSRSCGSPTFHRLVLLPVCPVPCRVLSYYMLPHAFYHRQPS